jgi:hypothetical protein
MAAKKKQAAEKVHKLNGKQIVEITLRPSLNAAAVIMDYSKSFGEQDFIELSGVLNEDIQKVNDGNMQRCEGMLMAQAEALQSIFVNLSRRSVTQEYLKNMETFLRLALKAQSQCRQTLETLSNIKNPPVVFAKQANFANGQQQVNNGVAATHAEEIKNQPNELLEAQYGGETLDSRATGATIGKDKAMAALE